MMSAFDIPKNLVALLGALALAALFATAHPAQADETAGVSISPNGSMAHHIELNTLRKLLSTPDLSHEEQLQLHLELTEIDEETA